MCALQNGALVGRPSIHQSDVTTGYQQRPLWVVDGSPLSAQERTVSLLNDTGTLLRHIALDVGEDCFEFGLAADRSECGVEVTTVAPVGSPAGSFGFAKSFEGLCTLVSQRVYLNVRNPVAVTAGNANILNLAPRVE